MAPPGGNAWRAGPGPAWQLLLHAKKKHLQCPVNSAAPHAIATASRRCQETRRRPRPGAHFNAELSGRARAEDDLAGQRARWLFGGGSRFWGDSSVTVFPRGQLRHTPCGHRLAPVRVCAHISIHTYFVDVLRDRMLWKWALRRAQLPDLRRGRSRSCAARKRLAHGAHTQYIL